VYRQILVPLDGTELSARAVPYARTLATRSRAGLILIQVVSEFADAVLIGRRDPDADVARARDDLAHVAAQDSAIPTEVMVRRGHAAEMIVRMAREREVDVIVMGRHQHAEIEYAILRSVGEDVVRRARIPVLAIPEHSAREWRPGHQGPVVVPLDGSALSHAILPDAIQLARAIGADLHLVRVVHPSTYILVEDDPDLPVGEVEINDVEAAEDELERVVESLAAENLDVTYEVRQDRNPAAAIVRAADESDAAAIAIATHGRGGLPRLALGSTADKVLRQTTVPILIVRPPSTLLEGPVEGTHRVGSAGPR
jgi:nucleotide-binding universal stress UspA family protein